MPRVFKKKSDEEKEHHGWCFTINNPTFSDCDEIEKLIPMAKYMIVGNEHAWTNGKPKPDGTHHFQCYINFKRSQKFAKVKKLLTRAKIIKADGEAADSQKYCSKDGDFREWGECPASRKRKGEMGRDAVQEKWFQIRKLAAERNFEKLREEYPHEYTKWRGCIDRVVNEDGENLDLPPGTKCGIWLTGKSGVGKTYWAMHKYEPDRKKIYTKLHNKWWDGFRPERHEVVVWNDYSVYTPQWATDLKIYAQEDEFPAEYKGGVLNIRPRMFIVTSQYRICDIWKDQETRDALYRRFTCMIKPNYNEDPIEDVDCKKENEGLKGGHTTVHPMYLPPEYRNRELIEE